MMITFWLIIGIGIYFLLKDKEAVKKKEDTAEDILKERYVNGEIDEASYRQMKNVINQ